jgi:hypothetical protein
MAAFTRDQYKRLVEIARVVYAHDGGYELDVIAKELFDMACEVIGQQSRPLEELESTTP